jgi:hypothetical protein
MIEGIEQYLHEVQNDGRDAWKLMQKSIFLRFLYE